jgi:glycosyltransferase involved in cell wall biosynthesis
MKGLSITVYCAQPSYFETATRVPKETDFQGVTIRRVWSTRFHRVSGLGRLLNALTFAASVAARILRPLPPTTVVLATTSPPSLPLVAALAKRLFKHRTIVVIHDVYPEIAVRIGAIRDGSLTHNLMRAIDAFALRHADRIVVLGRDMRDAICSKLPGEFAERVVVIPNWSDDSINALPKSESGHATRADLLGSFVVQYSGNVGLFQGLDVVVDAAHILRDSPIVFVIIGEGNSLRHLQSMVGDRHLSNVRFLPRVPKAELNDSLAACDVALVSLAPGATGLSVPSKYYGILASARPVIAIMSPEAEVAQSVLANDCGIVIPPDDPQRLSDALLDLLRNPRLVEAMGRNARRAFETHYGRRQAIDSYMNVIRS